MSGTVAIVPAAGLSSRMGALCDGLPSKLLLPLAESTVLGRSLRTLAESGFINKLIVPTTPHVREWWEQHSGMEFAIPVTFIDGGNSRAASVNNGLQFIQAECAAGKSSPADLLVLIHDAARCMLTPELVGRCIGVAAEFGAATAAVPCSDTITRANPAGDTVLETLLREELWSVQTPQVFRLPLLIEAHRRAKSIGALDSATDDAGLVEAIAPVMLVRADKGNLKVTTPEDYEYVRYITQAISKGISKPS